MNQIETVVTVVEDDRTKQNARADKKRIKSDKEALSILKAAFEAKVEENKNDK